MFLAMNRFRIAKGFEEAFERVWATRKSRLHELEGYLSFQLLKGPEREDHRLYATHTVWASQDHFLAWTRSEQFRESHRNAGSHAVTYLGHPEFEGFETILAQSHPDQQLAVE